MLALMQQKRLILCSQAQMGMRILEEAAEVAERISLRNCSGLTESGRGEIAQPQSQAAFKCVHADATDAAD